MSIQFIHSPFSLRVNARVNARVNGYLLGESESWVFLEFQFFLGLGPLVPCFRCSVKKVPLFAPDFRHDHLIEHRLFCRAALSEYGRK